MELMENRGENHGALIVCEGAPSQLIALLTTLPEERRFILHELVDDREIYAPGSETEMRDRDDYTTEDADSDSAPLTPPLSEQFAGRVGLVHGGGRAWSENTGDTFRSGVAAKYKAQVGQP